MLAVWNTILEKALRCVDEVHPDANTANADFYPVSHFLLEAATYIMRVAPIRILGLGKDLPVDDLTAYEDGSGSMPLPSNFLRLASFRMRGWRRAVNVPIFDDGPRYQQQLNPTLRGGEEFPVVALCDGQSRLEYYSSRLGPYAKVEVAKYFPVPSYDEEFPTNLVDVVAWKAAELSLSAMNDSNAAQIAAQKVIEHMQAL